jgi:inner membrane protein
MFIFAHVGITLAGATLVSGAIHEFQDSFNARVNATSSQNRKTPFSEIIGLKSLVRFLDLRLLIIGSMMPDIIDKPLALTGFGNGRSITHTLLISLVVLCIGVFLYINIKKTWLLAIVIGMLTHLILDLMWLTPNTLFWPLYGWSFSSPVISLGFEQIKVWWNALLTDPNVHISESIGLAVLLGMAWIIVNQKGLKTLLLKGKI